jgi:hypothetical protein
MNPFTQRFRYQEKHDASGKESAGAKEDEGHWGTA